VHVARMENLSEQWVDVVTRYEDAVQPADEKEQQTVG
jgi:hypothetical protein